MNDGGLAFPGKRYEMMKQTGKEEKEPVEVTYSGMSLRDYAVMQFAAAWIPALAVRRDVGGYSDGGASEEAVRLGAIQADAMIAQRNEEA